MAKLSVYYCQNINATKGRQLESNFQFTSLMYSVLLMVDEHWKIEVLYTMYNLVLSVQMLFKECFLWTEPNLYWLGVASVLG